VCNQPSRSTQSSTLCGMVKNEYKLSGRVNGDGGCGYVLPTGGPTAEVHQLG